MGEEPPLNSLSGSDKGGGGEAGERWSDSRQTG